MITNKLISSIYLNLSAQGDFNRNSSNTRERIGERLP
ncbi:MAG: hypothetical protein ACJA2S_005120 [Cyclobacteriaceae bacterium]|jgi:hypothetical protein